MTSARLPGILAVLTLAVASACGLQVQGDAPTTGSNDGGPGGGGDGSLSGGDGASSDDGGGNGDGSGSGSDGGGNDGGGGGDGASGDSGIGNTTVVYPMTPSALYTFDVVSHHVDKVGNFTNCGGGLGDIAVDSVGTVWGVSGGGLWAVSSIAVCAAAITFDHSGSTHGVSFPPTGQSGIYALQDGTKDLFSIPLTGGNQTTVKSNAFADDTGPDIVCSTTQCWEISPAGSNGCGNSSDCIYSIDATGGSGAIVGGILGNHKDVNGLAYARSKLYAFCGDGTILEIPPQSPGSAVPITPVLGTGISSAPGWQGAGSTNAAP